MSFEMEQGDISVSGQPITTNISGQVVKISGETVIAKVSGETVSITGTVTASVSGQPVSISGQPVLASASGNIIIAKVSGETIISSISGQVVTASVSGNIIQISGQAVQVASGLGVLAAQAGTWTINTSVSGQPVLTSVSGNIVQISGQTFQLASGPWVIASVSGETVIAKVSGETLQVASGAIVIAKTSGEVAQISGQGIITSTSGNWVNISGEPVSLVSGQAVWMSGQSVTTSISGDVVKVSGETVYSEPTGDWTSGLKAAQSGLGVLAAQAGTWTVGTSASGNVVQISGQGIITSVSGNIINISGGVVAFVSGQVIWISGQATTTSISGNWVNISGESVALVSGQVVWISGQTVTTSISGNVIQISGQGIITSVSGNIVKVSGETVYSAPTGDWTSGLKAAQSGLGVLAAQAGTWTVGTSVSGNWVNISGESVALVSGQAAWISGQSVVTSVSGNVVTAKTSGETVVAKMSGEWVSTSVSGNVVNVSGAKIDVAAQSLGALSVGHAKPAVGLDGSTSIIRVAHHSDLTVTTEDFTIVKKFRVRNLANNPVVFCKGSADIDGIYAQLESDGRIRIYTNQAGAHQQTYTAAGKFIVNTDYIIHITRTGAVCAIYIDGVDSTFSAGTHVDPTTNTRTLYLDCYDDLSLKFDGIDYWDRFYKGLCMTQAQVTEDYANPERPILSSLKLWLKLDEGTGTTAKDNSGLGHGGTLVSCVWVSEKGTVSTPPKVDANIVKQDLGALSVGHAKPAVGLDGSASYISVAHHSDLTATSEDFTLVLELLLHSLAAEVRPFSKGLLDTDGIFMQVSAGGGVYFRTNQSGANQVSYTATGAVTINTKYTIHITRTGSSVRIYVNAVDKTSTAATHVDPTTNTRTLYVGQYDDGTFRLPGIVYSKRFYKGKAFTQAEITEDYANPNTPITNSLKLWLKLDEGTGSEARDSSELGHHGTLVACAWVSEKGEVSPIVAVRDVNLVSQSGAFGVIVVQGSATQIVATRTNRRELDVYNDQSGARLEIGFAGSLVMGSGWPVEYQKSAEFSNFWGAVWGVTSSGKTVNAPYLETFP